MFNHDKCPTCGRKKPRTSRQNSRYWALVREFGLKYNHTAEVVHEYFKRRFLPMREVEMPDWSTQLLPTSTHDLTMTKCEGPNREDYTLAVEHFCAESGVYLDED